MVTSYNFHTLALIGSHNTDKTTLFNALTGLSQQYRTPLPRPGRSLDQARRKARRLGLPHRHDRPHFSSRARVYHLSTAHYLPPRQWRKTKNASAKWSYFGRHLARRLACLCPDHGAVDNGLLRFARPVPFDSSRHPQRNWILALAPAQASAIYVTGLAYVRCRDKVSAEHGARPLIMDQQTLIAIDSQLLQIESPDRS